MVILINIIEHILTCKRENQVSATIVPRHKERREVQNLKNQVSQLIAFWKHQNKIACATRALQKQHMST